jgi:hypothetical protein
MMWIHKSALVLTAGEKLHLTITPIQKQEKPKSALALNMLGL